MTARPSPAAIANATLAAMVDGETLAAQRARHAQEERALLARALGAALGYLRTAARALGVEESQLRRRLIPRHGLAAEAARLRQANPLPKGGRPSGGGA